MPPVGSHSHARRKAPPNQRLLTRPDARFARVRAAEPQGVGRAGRRRDQVWYLAARSANLLSRSGSWQSRESRALMFSLLLTASIATLDGHDNEDS